VFNRYDLKWIRRATLIGAATLAVSMFGVPAAGASGSDVSFSGETCSQGQFSGTVNVAFPYTGTITVELFYNPQQHEFNPPMTVDVSFNNSTSGTYSFSGLAATNPPSGPSAYLAGAVGSSGTPTLDTSATHAKSKSLECTGPTLAAVSRFTVTRHQGTVLFHWRAAQHATVLGFSVYAGTHRLGTMIPVHASSRYSYRAHWSGAGPFTLRALLRDGSTVSLSR
jgi:hypothetical protein